jgi:hypothetical protein
MPVCVVLMMLLCVGIGMRRRIRTKRPSKGWRCRPDWWNSRHSVVCAHREQQQSMKTVRHRRRMQGQGHRRSLLPHRLDRC